MFTRTAGWTRFIIYNKRSGVESLLQNRIGVGSLLYSRSGVEILPYSRSRVEILLNRRSGGKPPIGREHVESLLYSKSGAEILLYDRSGVESRQQSMYCRVGGKASSRIRARWKACCIVGAGGKACRIAGAEWKACCIVGVGVGKSAVVAEARWNWKHEARTKQQWEWIREAYIRVAVGVETENIQEGNSRSVT